MCRIAGIVSSKPGIDEIRKKVAIMCDALKHGGPDDEGIFSADEANLVLGHRRLSIIDLSKNGHQPMADIAKKAWITFNGEIYNYLELKAELVKHGAQFYSQTDTEVILQAYLYWGTASFNKLRGMFAFALYDVAKGVTYLVRDSTGIKPLYYHIENGELSFSSEVKPLKLAGIAKNANKTWPVKFLAFGHIPEPDTILNNVFSLSKGHYLCWDQRNNTHSIACYTQTLPLNYIGDKNIAEHTIQHTLETAVKRQLIADAPVGVFLSGGIDSSLITLLASRYKQQQLKTVSLFFNEKDYDERAYQQLIADKIPGEKFTHLIKQQDFETSLPDIINAMDMPTTDGINTWFISHYARKDGLKAVLSGLGADEFFGGYPSFERVKYIKYLRSIPFALINAAGYFMADRYKKIRFLASEHPFADYLSLRGLFTPNEIAEILNCDKSEVYDILFSTDNVPDPGITNQERASWFETNLYMQNQLLRDTDVMSMNHGLEVRVPFLDEDFQQAANRISPAIRFNKQQPKKILITAFKDILPQPVWDRPKMGFSFPLQQWMQQNAGISNADLYKGKKAQSVVRKFKKGEVHWSKAYALYQVEPHV
jgi:asparagine synthase (glutamine-hydrolysing)